MIQLLQSSLGLPQEDRIWLSKRPAPKDPLFLSIDCEFMPGLDRGVREVGISTLDTRALKNLSVETSTVSELQNVITTYNFTRREKEKPRAYIFDKWAHATREELSGFIRHLMRLRRDVVIIGQSIPFDVLAMTRDDLHLPKAPQLDTYVIAQQLHLHERSIRPMRLTLGGLLDEHRIPYHPGILHNGGNDSHLTLRLLLMLAVRSVKDSKLSASEKSSVSVLRAIALTPLMKHPRFNDALFKEKMETTYAKEEFNVTSAVRRSYILGHWEI